MTTLLRYITINSKGFVDLHVTFTNLTTDDFDLVFDPADTLTDTSGNGDTAYSDEGGTGHIHVAANGSTDYVISFGGLNPTPGTKCRFRSDVEQGGDFTIYYTDIMIPCR